MPEREKLKTTPDNYKAWNITEKDYISNDLSSLIQWAVLAPSSHNTQPWSFSVKNNSIRVAPNLERKLAVSDPTLREMYISLGAAICNLKVAANYFGLRTEEQLIQDEKTDTTQKVISFKPGYARTLEDSTLFKAITQRVSNRSAHNLKREIPEEIKIVIANLADKSGLDIELVEDKKRLAQIGKLVKTGQMKVLTNHEFTNELADWVKHNQTDSPLGMPAFGFGLSGIGAQAFVRGIRVASLVAPARAAEEEKLMKDKTASVGVISTEKDEPEYWMKAGEKFEEIALRAASLGLSANVLAVLVETGDLHEGLQRVVGTEYRPQIMFRLGIPTYEIPHAPRLQAKKVTDLGTEKEERIPKDKPTVFKLTEGVDSVDCLLKELGEDVEVEDAYSYWIDELFRIRNPQLDFRTDQAQEAANEYIAARNNHYDGVWVYSPWKKKLEHLPLEDEFNEIFYSRNYPSISKETQKRLGETTVAIAGLSVGSNIAIDQIRTGVRKFHLADFDFISPSNLQRMSGATIFDIGKNKAQNLAEYLYSLNPYVDIKQYPDGVNDSNIAEFMDADICFDEVDNILLKIKLRQEQRRNGKTIIAMGTDLEFNPPFEFEFPDDPQIFNGRVKPEVIETLLKGPRSAKEWIKNASQVMGLENLPTSVLQNFINIYRDIQNYNSQLGATCSAVSAKAAYFTIQMASGNIEKLQKFSTIQIGQADLEDIEERSAKLEEFKELFGIEI